MTAPAATPETPPDSSTVSSTDSSTVSSGRKLLPLYALCLLGGLAGAGYVFFGTHMSEAQLVQAAWVWTFPVVFGAYGLLAERGLRRVRAGQSRTLGVAFLAMTRLFGLGGVLVLGILLLPLLLLSRLKSSLALAIIGAGFWAGLLWFFFEAVFPSL